jgi:hypothetical protein
MWGFKKKSTKKINWLRKNSLYDKKVIRKVRKRRHWNPCLGHIGDEISKKREKKYTGLQWGMKLSLAANWVLNWVCLVLSFPERLQPITGPAMCTVGIDVPAHETCLMLSLSISYPDLIKFHYFADNNSQEGVKHLVKGATHVQESMTLLDNSTVWVILFV